ncbi:PPC domain-containing DNA-binding protein [Photobacterium sp. Alg240-V54]|uniref:PPC domain-containing DNA-binding protein n=1 Tax=Photobacterium sp. Alg240-V54 TaxID=2305995 RepID=UPI0013D7FF8D|nr:PPC domain-containing DNA-binding protein [Photobacterium sp. Alg240-V54]
MITPYAKRLVKGDDLRNSLLELVKVNSIQAGSLLTGVGCLSHANIRLANENNTLNITGPLEIITLSGTLTPQHIHVHISVADREGNVYGGHLMPGCIVSYTAELCMVAFNNIIFSRDYDPQTGFDELVISDKNN